MLLCSQVWILEAIPKIAGISNCHFAFCDGLPASLVWYTSERDYNITYDKCSEIFSKDLISILSCLSFYYADLSFPLPCYIVVVL